jgi:hypothetical protein
MPEHNTQSKSKTRSAVTGHQLGRAALRAESKNAGAVAAFVKSVLEGKPEAAITLARVLRTVGGGRVQVRLCVEEPVEMSVRIAGRVAFKGKASNKTDRGACMTRGDFVVVDGLLAIGKLEAGDVATVREHLEAPRGFFEDEAEEHVGYEFADGSDDEDEEAEVDIDAI